MAGVGAGRCCEIKGSESGWFYDECGGTDVLADFVGGVFPCFISWGGGVVAAANPLAVV